MKIPKSFKKSLSNKELKEKNERAKRLEADNKYKQLCKEYSEKEQSLLKKKVELCKKIFTWKNEFLSTKEGKRALKRSENNLWVFAGNWGHELPEFGQGGCWSRIYFNDNSIEYMAGYKWMGGGDPAEFTKPETMAKILSYEYLSNLVKEINNKSVFKNILKLNTD